MREQVFDAINEWHQGHVHMGQEKTWTYCAHKYFNVTQSLVKIYCKTCIACSKKNLVGDAQKGSRKPIWSLMWQERFELDLINFCKLRKRGPFGVLMHWILTLNDHATALVYLCALSRKRANLICKRSLGSLTILRSFTFITGRSSRQRLFLNFFVISTQTFSQ